MNFFRARVDMPAFNEQIPKEGGVVASRFRSVILEACRGPYHEHHHVVIGEQYIRCSDGAWGIELFQGDVKIGTLNMGTITCHDSMISAVGWVLNKALLTKASHRTGKVVEPVLREAQLRMRNLLLGLSLTFNHDTIQPSVLRSPLAEVDRTQPGLA